MLSARTLVVRAVSSIVSPPLFTAYPQRAFINTKKHQPKEKTYRPKFNSRGPKSENTEVDKVNDLLIFF